MSGMKASSLIEPGEMNIIVVKAVRLLLHISEAITHVPRTTHSSV